MNAPKRVTILGSTGSIGDSTIDLIERDPTAYQVVALTGNGNWKKLADQARRLKPEMAVIADVRNYQLLKDALAGTNRPTLAAVERGAVVGLANKECLVCAGHVFMGAVKDHKATLLPVDSEHNAIFQVFDFSQKENISKVILTASGGPFRKWTRAEMETVTPEQAVAHPNWSMGAKISVDSATMMNKGLEIIEAHHLFGLPDAQIDVVVHPQSVVHSLVEYTDGSTLAQMGTPDMRTPIAYTLGWPKRVPAPTGRLNLAQLGTLTFEAPDPVRFPALRLARAALQSGGAAPTILNAANEVAVARFLAGEIGFLDIAAIVEQSMTHVPAGAVGSLDEIMVVDAEARRFAAAAKRTSAAAAE